MASIRSAACMRCSAPLLKGNVLVGVFVGLLLPVRVVVPQRGERLNAGGSLAEYDRWHVAQLEQRGLVYFLGMIIVVIIVVVAFQQGSRGLFDALDGASWAEPQLDNG